MPEGRRSYGENMKIEEIRRQSLEYAKGNVRPEKRRKKRRNLTFKEWFVKSLQREGHIENLEGRLRRLV